MKLSKIRNIALICALLVIAFGSGYRFAVYNKPMANIMGSNQMSDGKDNADMTLFWDVWSRLNKYYVDKKSLDKQKMIYGAISGMVPSAGDPYTVFLPPSANKEAKDDLGGKFEGIGAQLGISESKIIVVAPLKGAPAENAGIKPGDWIVKVDGNETLNWTLPEAVSKIRGEKGTKVNLTILHKEASKTAEITVVRDEIKIDSVESGIKYFKNNCGEKDICIIDKKEDCPDCSAFEYLKLSRFGDRTTDEWNKAVSRIASDVSSDKNIKGLVLDLRNNPGGYLTGSVFIASEFLEKGIIVMQENSEGKRQNYEVNRKGNLTKIPMTVLINKGSASASEIVAGALKDLNRAKIIGEKSFGKGSIQEAQELTGGSGIHITIAKWLTPSGNWIHGKGVEPDVNVEMDDANPAKDVQLEKAFENLIY